MKFVLTSQQADAATVVRMTRSLGTLALLLWATSCYKQSLPYPFLGTVWAGVLALLCFVTGWLVLIDFVPIPLDKRPLIGACAFTLWMTARWIADGSPVVGIENVITVLTWCAWLFVATHLASLTRVVVGSHSQRSAKSAVLFFPLLALGILAGLFALHAILQYFVLYDRQLAELRASIGNRAATPLEMGLIHHFQLKRVASVWGDPNAFGCFCALGLGAAYFLWREAKAISRPLFPRSLAGAIALVCGIGILLSGSRGALLDVLVLLIIIVASHRWTQPRRIAAVSLGIILCALSSASSPADQTQPMASSWWRRSDTIRERIHYAEIGWKIFLSAPVVGAGPGSVEKYYGRLKPAEARESKFLHNWLLQIAAETGIIGVLLYCATILSLLKAVVSLRKESPSSMSILAALIVTFLVDSFFELSFNQRELMATFGLLGGLGVGAAPAPPATREDNQRGGRWLLVLMSFTLGLLLALVAVPRSLANGFRQLAESKLEARDFTGSEEVLRRALQWSRKDPASLALYGELLRQMNDFSGAEQSFRHALQSAPWSAVIRLQLADTLKSLGKFDEAEKLLRAAIALYPTKAEYWHELALFLESRGRLPEALEAAEKACQFSYLYPERDQALKRRLKEKLQAKSLATTSTLTRPQ